MRDAVFDEFGSVDLKPEPFVPAGQLTLGVQDNRRGSRRLERNLHESRGQAGAACVGSGADPTDPAVVGVVEDPQICSRTDGIGGPDVPSARFDITAVQFGVRAVLLDHEDVDPQAEQVVEGPRIELGEGRYPDRGHLPSLAQRTDRDGRLDPMAKKIATNDRVGLDELLDFVRPRHQLILTTHRRDGSPQLSPVTGGVDEQG
ncbi:MAG: class F420-dependent enzyme, partial [Pseudonocardiales bacterium]|nr:class F420-dependent enzyme [Pseudonocardiales bacterium]